MYSNRTAVNLAIQNSRHPLGRIYNKAVEAIKLDIETALKFGDDTKTHQKEDEHRRRERTPQQNNNIEEKKKKEGPTERTIGNDG